MQIFDDSKKRIALLTGYKEREITKTLSSGDKEMVFQYPANGKDTEALKEEYYIRTKTDEYVIKAVEKGETYNKYTAVLNVEELEGEAFAYGFASQEQTIRACLEFAFEDTGWTVGTCEITKKRTINIEESTTAWKVLQSCLKTYRCECNIDTLNKRVNIYEHIGRDRGCYFVEGMNLRKLTINSDTYDFYTRILPLGKDGISIEFLHGKEYLENYQYSTKVKTYVWKDERYTNTTSLMEDAEAKLEEMSKPYKVFAADVVDLAKQNPDYKDILDYGIGDTVRMVSKKTHTREKQRIVKITEYPENPKKNKVELSNTTKTFAEVQKTEAELSKNETIDIANKSTQKVLEDKYWTKKEVESHITASKEEVSLGVSKIYETKDAVEEKIKLSDGRTDEKLTKYYTKEETKSAIDMSAESINLEVSKTYATQTTVTEKYNSAVKKGQTAADAAEKNAKDAMYEKLTEYSTTEEMKSAIDLKVDEINLSVSKTYATQTTVTEKYNSAVKAGQDAANNAEANAIKAGQTAADAAEKNAKDAMYEKLTEYSTTEEMKSAIDLKVDEINLSVSKTYATQTTVTEKYNSAVKKGQTAADAAEKNAIADTTQRLKSYSTTEEMNAAIKLKADGITTEVNKKVSNSEFGTKITQNAYNVRVAWNNNSNYIQLESGKLVIYNGETTTNQKRAAFDQNGNHFYRDGYYVGKIGTNYWSDNDAHKGLVFDLDYQGKYMAFAQKPSSSSNAYSTMLCFSRANSIYNTYGVHMGCDLDMHNYKLKNVSWEKGGITGTLNFVKVVSMDSDGTVNTWTNGCKLQFENGILIAGTW